MKFGTKMAMPRWMSSRRFKKVMAIVRVILYSSDVGSDFWVRNFVIEGVASRPPSS